MFGRVVAVNTKEERQGSSPNYSGTNPANTEKPTRFRG